MIELLILKGIARFLRRRGLLVMDEVSALRVIEYKTALQCITNIVGTDPANATLEGARVELEEIQDVAYQALTGEPSRIWEEPIE
jgi:hypothetical protein